MPRTSIPGFDPNTTVGALEGGVLVSNLLFGIVTMQVYLYYQKYPRDRWSLKALVGLVWLLELAHTICVMHGIYVTTITRRGRTVLTIPASLRIAFFFSGTVGPIVQAFFATRVAKCFDKPYLAILCWILMCYRFLSNLVMTAVSVKAHEQELDWALTSSLVIEAAVDLLIAISLCYYLVKSQRRSVHQRTIRLIDRLIGMTLPTGLVTCIVAIIVIVCYLKMENNFVWVALMFCQTKVCSNSMLASLNGRSILRDDLEGNMTPGHLKSHQLEPIPVEITTHIDLSSFQSNEHSITNNLTSQQQA
ncbi:hypothetical protein PILCRDRAFT_824236 [Piloderma croceum F 1598]|uniref:DUF6534 domain-containing protein n=1 Tax=Piloderma croceum (strain F 1598) TaxID=765440 RepID=A0A0C3FFN7_PILCF|nr:hypothetical protein PILCRDRAFT_824236 [Piloderma croceum F 1598]